MKLFGTFLLTIMVIVFALQTCKTKHEMLKENENKTNKIAVEKQKNDSINKTQKNGIVQMKDSTKRVKKPQTVIQDTVVYTFAEVMPQYPGGDIEMYRFIGKNIDYSNIGKVEPWGRAHVKFTVTSDGAVENIQIINEKRIPDVIEERIINVVKLLSGWSVGRIQDKPVSVWKTITIREPY